MPATGRQELVVGSKVAIQAPLGSDAAAVASVGKASGSTGIVIEAGLASVVPLILNWVRLPWSDYAAAGMTLSV